MKLILNTGDEFEVRDGSNESCIISVCDKKTADKIKEKCTTQTLKHAKLDDAVLQDIILEDICIGETDDGDAFVTISLRKKSEIDILKERIAEQDAALMELAGMIGE